MAENGYNIAISAPPLRKLDHLDVKIVRYDLNMAIKDWNLKRKFTRFWMVYWNNTPGASVEFSDRTVELTPGRIVLIPPYTLVSGHTRQAFIHNFIEFTAGSPFDSVKGEVLVFPVGEYIKDPPEETDPVRLSLELYILVERLLLSVPKDFFIMPVPQFSDTRIQGAIKYMETHFKKKISIRKLCNYVNLSESHFVHLFKEKVGISPRFYWMKLRINLAVRLLEDTDLSFSEIAEEAGFTDRSHMARILRETYGVTLSMIRKKINRKEPQ